MNNGQKSLSINETFIVEAENDGTMSACTGFFTNALVSCDGNTQILLGNNIIETNCPFSATTFYGDGSNLTGISTQDIFVTGGTYDQNSGIATFINNTGGTFNVTGFYTGATDIYVTAVTFTNNLLTLYRNDGVTFGATIDNFTSLNVDGPVSATTFYGDGSNLSGVSKQDTVVTGGTYYDGVSTFTNNTGGTFSITGPSNYYAGVILGGENWVNNGDGSIDLPEIKVGLFDNANNIEPLRIYTISSGTTGVGGIPPLADNDTNYIIIEYNGGSPRYNVLDNDGTVTSSDVVLYMIVYRANNFVHTLEFGDMGAGLTNKLNTRLISTDRFARESGCALGLSGVTGIVTLSSGVVWNGPYEQIVSAVNSQDDIFFKSFHSGGTWVYATTGNTINNNYYDDGTDLVLATAGKYLVNWYFRGQEINDHLYELISYGEYNTVQLAEASPEPNLPELITSHAFLVGRIIVGVSATTGITQSAFTTVFQPSGAPVLHNDLAGIQGGVAGQYYHLDSNKYNNLALTNTNNNFSVGQSFNAGVTATTVSATTYLNLSILTSGTTIYSNNPATSNFSSNNGVFFGTNAGQNATNANNSVFMGQNAGSGATNASNSVFIGQSAGLGATNSVLSYFFGQNAGRNAVGSFYSNFIGESAGDNVSIAQNSNFLGRYAGSGATNANSSNFLGNSAGALTSADNSNFLGFTAGFQATNADFSNFLGNSAGYSATSANYSNFFGFQSGYQAINADNSNFLGNRAGYQATNAEYSNFLGLEAGYQATNASGSTFIGQQSGYQATGATNSVFLGYQSGRLAANAVNSNFIGFEAGEGATNANDSTFFGLRAGSVATNASGSTFIGGVAGLLATNAANSNFFGFSAGNGAIAASNSNFLGNQAGNSANNANNSNFLGRSAGNSATNANNSNFLGNGAGSGATGANNSTFIGQTAGSNASAANNSIFIGRNTGSGATNASSSIIMGQGSGRAFTGNNIGSNNIIIGTNISLPNSTSNSINIGGILFGTGSYSTTTGNPSISAQAQGRIGINVVSPQYSLHVSGDTFIEGGLTATTISATTYLNLPSTPTSFVFITGDTTLSNANQTVIVDSLTAITVTLPQITANGTLITIKNINTGVETILPYSGQLIDGDTSVVVARRNVSLDFQSYNNNWYLI
jgi:hypothetical protein